MAAEIDELSGQVQSIIDQALRRLTRSIPFLVRWRDRIVYSIVLAAGLGAVASLRDTGTAVVTFAVSAIFFFAVFRRYDRVAEQVPEFTPEERKELLRLRAGISQRMKPVDEPTGSYWRPRRPTISGRPCGWCASTEATWTGHYPPFSSGDPVVETACQRCLRGGRGALRVTEGDLLALRGTIEAREPDLTSADLDRRVRGAAEELRRTPAPPLPADWPQCCGDFCRFEGAWDPGDFAVACGSFDAAVLAEFIDHACGRSIDRSPAEMAAHADLLAATPVMWQVFRCRTCNRLFATPFADSDQS